MHVYCVFLAYSLQIILTDKVFFMWYIVFYIIVMLCYVCTMLLVLFVLCQKWRNKTVIYIYIYSICLMYVCMGFYFWRHFATSRFLSKIWTDNRVAIKTTNWNASPKSTNGLYVYGPISQHCEKCFICYISLAVLHIILYIYIYTLNVHEEIKHLRYFFIERYMQA